MSATKAERIDAGTAALAALREARERTLEIVADLSDDQLLGPRLSIVNPLLWEIGHLAWFDEHWLLRYLRGLPPLLEQGDSLYDSARVPHDTRWDLPLPSRVATLAYMRQVLERIETEHARESGQKQRMVDGYDELYFLQLALFHEYMHAEAFAYTRQTLGYPTPQMATASPGPLKTFSSRSEKLGDAEVPGGTFPMGSRPGSRTFVFDNEQWAHMVTVQPFRIARAAVTSAEFSAFVEAGGYRREQFWTPEGWQWRQKMSAEHPVYWKRQQNGDWLRRHFDTWVPLEPDLPVLHVNWYEADAYCKWAKRRLPTEAEWEMAASCEPGPNGQGVVNAERVYPWGNQPPNLEHGNLDWSGAGCLPAAALPASESAFGVRQMIGNTWEWMADDFQPYPGFSPGPYKEYSAPWFGDHKVLRGGCWATRSLMIRNTYRNFYKPDRRDVWAGFRTCAL